MIPPQRCVDEVLEKHLLTIDRGLWNTLNNIQKVCGELFAQYIFKNSNLSDMCQEIIKTIEKEKKDIKNAHRPKEDNPVFNWTV